MFLHFFFLLVYFVVSLFSSDIALSIVLMSHSAATLIERHLMRKEKIDPMTCYGLYSFLVGIANIVMISASKAGTLPAGYSYIIPANIVDSIGIFFVGNVFIFMGFELFFRKSLPKIDVLIESKKNHDKLFLLMLVFSARALLFPERILGSLTLILTVFSSVGIIFFARLWAKTDEKKYGSYAFILCFLQTGYALFYSYLRMELLMPTLSLTFGYFLGKGSLKPLFSYRIIPIFIALYVFNMYFSFLGKNRETYGEIKGLARVTKMVTLANVETIYAEEESQESILHRASVLPQLTNIVELVKTKGHFNGDVSAPLFIALVPRFLWPEKPLIGLGAWFATEIGQGAQTDSWYTNSINMTIQGQLFLDFGWTGTVAGGLFIGAILALIWNATGFFRSPYNITGVTLGGYLLLAAMQGIGADLQFLVTLLSYYLIFVVFKKFA